MIRDALLLGALVVSVAAFCTFSVAQSYGLVRARRFGLGLVALVLPPLGAYFAWREGMRRRAIGVVTSGLVYVVIRSLG
jgi:predicted MFS family arabinose efflux permease